ncbi:MAG: UDP-N-acetylmuramoyl-tripeptide--D-alanyl-D-alanine ligase [Verrucomicrobiota bacterium]
MKPAAGFTMDARSLRAGEVFVAIKTDRRDGHDFLAQAAAAGASAALVSRADPAVDLPQLVVADPLKAFQAIARAHRCAFKGQVVGITGSAGKTSTKNLLALLLGGAEGGPEGGVLATEGNLNNHLGVPLTLTKIDPDAHRFAVIEAGISEPGEMAPLADMILPDVSIVTLVAPAHIEALGSVEGVAAEKARLPAATRAGGIAVFPRQCAQFTPFRKLGVDTMIVEPADVVRPARPPEDRVYFTVTHRGAETALAIAYGEPPPLVFTCRRVSDGMAQNAVLAVCAALWLGVEPADIRARLAGWTPAALRGEVRRDADGRLLYLDCYNANPAAMTDALDAFAGIAPAAEPRLYVLGCMGELGPQSPMLHRALGRNLRLRAGDHVCVIGDDAEQIRLGALEGGIPAEQIDVVQDLDAIRERLVNFNGAVFIKGSRRYKLETLVSTEAAAH